MFSFDPTVSLGNIITLFTLGLPAIWWAAKVTTLLKDTRDDVSELKQNAMPRSEVAILKASADVEHVHLQKQINGLRDDARAGRGHAE